MSTSRVGRRIGALALLSAVGLASTGTGVAVPPPPPNPSDAEIQSGEADAERTAGRAGELANRLADAESRLVGLQSQVEVKMEDANKARVDLQRAETAYGRARLAADAAAAEARAAAQQIEAQRSRLDQFAASSYRQGSRLGSITAYVGARNPQEVLERASLLDALSDSQLDVLDDLERARIEKVNKDSLTRAALQEAEARRRAADEARATAEAAQQAAVQARAQQAVQAQSLQADRDAVQAELDAARSRVSGLQTQREDYQEWVQDKAREEQAAAAAAAKPSQNHSGGSGQSSASSSGDVEAVISRALSQLGMPYAWGGGNSRGPTRGIRDGGVADSYGDYAKIGFDCSGLMIYAFAAGGVSLDHYSGYQAQSGKRVPLSQMRRGDMLFWNDGGRIHHVALYLGGGKMVEAPYSGSRVRVTSVRYSGIAPYAVRVL
ncbi:NlpC/P60 family protein [Saccharopolyspora rhizosphaerae]|uniref:NlpC/P60 family protein n=1 Tax=Saccharopolyspora rhizosphaerae TaxID=2492662 RepID=A0A3R8Q7X1_9PSEU|nr:NlpC/P60 family protein [Saccharopolyspora rhizosphaerae]RRO20480.1 NlpC/P60 family protein [Saccharopolyspora rhizosphaerae]